MKEGCEEKRVKSFSLKIKNADKIERIAYEEKIKQSQVVDEMVEEFNGNR